MTVLGVVLLWPFVVLSWPNFPCSLCFSLLVGANPASRFTAREHVLLWSAGFVRLDVLTVAVLFFLFVAPGLLGSLSVLHIPQLGYDGRVCLVLGAVV